MSWFLKSDYNLGDHYAISTIIENLKEIKLGDKINKKQNKIKINCTNYQYRILYQTELTRQLNESGDLSSLINGPMNQSELKIRLSEMLNRISSLMLNSARETEKKLESTKKRSKKIGQKKFNKWWNKELEELHLQVIKCYLEYKASNFGDLEKVKFADAKRIFRRQKRLNIAIKKK